MITGFKKNRGFSLVELAVIVTLAGIAVEVISTQFAQYMNTKAMNITTMRNNEISQAFSRYLFNSSPVSNSGGLPCPAPPLLPPSDPRAGVADCSMANLALHPPSTWPACDPVTGICVVAGARWTSNNTTYCPGPAACGAQAPFTAAYKDPVLIGTLPYVDLGIALNDSVDGWNNRMTYAVSYYMTNDPSGNNPGHYDGNISGAINVESYNSLTNSISPSSYTLSNGSVAANAFMLAVVSHGPDGKGAWNYYGQKTVPCDMTPIDMGTSAPSPTSTGRDNENCNGDSTFLLNGTSSQSNIYALASGPYFYDDAFVITSVYLATDKWEMSSMGLIDNKGGGSVEIGSSTPPNAQLDVSGDIRATNFDADQFCDKATKNCFEQKLISPGLDCNNGLMTGVASSKPQCLTLLSTTGLTPLTCQTGQYVNGIDANGSPTCVNP